MGKAADPFHFNSLCICSLVLVFWLAFKTIVNRVQPFKGLNIVPS